MKIFSHFQVIADEITLQARVSIGWLCTDWLYKKIRLEWEGEGCEVEQEQ